MAAFLESLCTIQSISRTVRVLMQKKNEGPSRLLTTKEAAEHLGLKEVTLRTWRRTGSGPMYVELSPRAVRYRPEDLQSFAESRMRSSTSCPVGKVAV